MTSSQRIVLNTLATYGRSVLTFGLNLFTARWVLLALGQVDLGLFGVVGSIISFIGFISMVMRGAVTRFYAYSIGYGKTLSPDDAVADLRRWFNTALAVYFALPLLLVLIGLPIGEYAIRHWLTIPPDRLAACLWVFRISLLGAFLGMVAIPYTAMYTAYQLITVLAVFDIVRVVVLFFGTFALLRWPGDRLIAYAVLVMLVNAGIPLMLVMLARLRFKACRVVWREWFDRSRLAELFSFAGWQMFGGLGAILRNQGSAILVNLHFGPSANAAYSISNQLSAQASTLSGAMQNALTPAITTAEGSGHREQAIDLSLRACKFSTFLALILILPLLLELEEVLHLWLKAPPDHTAILSCCMMVMMIIDKLTFGHMILVAAHGEIALYQAMLGTALILTLPLAWLLIKAGMGLASVGVAFVATVSVASVGRVLFCRSLFGMSPKIWLTRVVGPLVMLMVVAGGLGALCVWSFPAGLPRLFLTVAVTEIVILALGWWGVFDAKERGFALRMFSEISQKMKALA
jgi:O-antigen/teichoic acid export membrane protein